MRVYAIGDIHGQLAMLQAAHRRIEKDCAGDADAVVIHLGDLTDRGPHSKQTLDYLMNGMQGGAPWVVIKGNHDRMFSYFMRDPSLRDMVLRPDLEWTHPRLGGQTTLNSYGVETEGRSDAEIYTEARKRVPAAHVRFLENLPVRYATPDLLFVHAGINPERPLDQQIEDDLVWIRDPFLTSAADHGPLIIHGHTVVDTPEHKGNRVNLDTGAGYGKPLTAAVFEGRSCWILGPDGREPLNPSE